MTRHPARVVRSIGLLVAGLGLASLSTSGRLWAGDNPVALSRTTIALERPGYRLHAELVAPPNAQHLPAIVLTGRTTDCPCFWQFEELAVALASGGRAVLVLDRASESAASFPRHVADVEAAVAWLALRPEVDATRIGLWGFSQESLVPIATAAAGRAPIAFLVLGSPLLARQHDFLLEFTRAQLEQGGSSPEQSAAAARLLGDLWTYYETGAGWPEIQAHFALGEKQPWFGRVEDFGRGLAPPAYIAAHPDTFVDFQTERVLDPIAQLVSFRGPTLVLLGTSDDLLRYETYASARRRLEALRVPGVRVVSIDGADHFLRKSGAGDRLVAGILEAVSDWVGKPAGQRKD